MYGLYDLFLAAGLGGAVLGALGILSRPHRTEVDARLALAVLACFLFPLIDHLVKPAPDIAPGLKQADPLAFLLFLTRNGYYLTGPLLWLYAKALLEADPKPFKGLLLHSLPFFLWLILNVVFQDQFKIFPAPARPALGVAPGSGPPPVHVLALARDLGSFVSPILYGGLILFRLKKHSGKVEDFYSTSSSANTLSWLAALVVVMVLINAAALAVGLAGIFRRTPPGLAIPFLRSVPAVLFIFFFAHFSREQRIPKDTRSDFNPEKYQRSALDQGLVDQIYAKLLVLMEDHRPYLDPDLTLDDLAARLGETKHHLSQTINSKAQGNFYTFVNAFRIREFCRLIESGRFAHYTLLALAYECGFRSSSAFYSLCKKTTGMTPKEYAESLSLSARN